MAAIGRGVEQHVVRLGLDASLQHALERRVVGLIFFGVKGEVIGEDQKACRPTPQGVHELAELPQLVACELHEPEPVHREARCQRLDRGGLSRSPVAMQERVVRREAVDETPEVGEKGGPLSFVAHQVVEGDGIGRLDTDELSLPTEDPVMAQHTGPEAAKVCGEHADSLAPVWESGERSLEISPGPLAGTRALRRRRGRLRQPLERAEILARGGEQARAQGLRFLLLRGQGKGTLVVENTLKQEVGQRIRGRALISERSPSKGADQPGASRGGPHVSENRVSGIEKDRDREHSVVAVGAALTRALSGTPRKSTPREHSRAAFAGATFCLKMSVPPPQLTESSGATRAFTLDGRRFPTGSPVLVVFWKHDCPTCDLVLPIVDRCVGSQLEVLSVSQSELELTSEFVARHRIKAAVVRDADLTVSDAWEIDTVPSLFLCDPSGQVSAEMTGWDAGAFQRLMSVAGLPEPALSGAPAHRPGCGSRNVEPEIASRLRVRRESSRLRSRRLLRPPLVDPIEYFFERGLTDGLPVVPPTEERVLTMLDGTTRPADEVVALVPPNLVEATVEKVAISAVMAGCLPQHLPVVIAALEAVCTDEFNMHGLLATTYFAGPVLIVNGPVRDRIGMNSGHNALGQGNRANATIGRALQLIVRNLGGGRPGEIDKATLGNPGKYTFCFAESQEASPWEPFHVERGFEPSDSTVTAFAGEGPRAVVDQISRGARQVATSLGLCAATVGHPKLPAAFDALVIVSPEHCARFANEGWSKMDVRARIREVTTRPLGEWRRDEECGEGLPAGAISDDDSMPLSKFVHDGQLPIVVAGSGAGLFSAIVGGWVSGSGGSQMVTRRITP
jgi:thiol-disulfide isomerase/thioredoxin